MKKLQKISELYTVLAQKQDRQSIVFMSGVFDLFHYGHYKALEKASKLGMILVVQVDGNKIVKKRKGPERPFVDEKLRAEVISKLDFVDYVFISNIPSESKNTLQMISPDIYIRSIIATETDKDRKVREEKILNNLPKTKILWLEQMENISTTLIVDTIKKNISRSESRKSTDNFFNFFDKSHNFLKFLKNSSVFKLFL